MVFKENVIGWGQPLRPPTHLPFIPHLVSCRPHKKIFSNQISRGNFGTGERVRERKTPILSFYATFISALQEKHFPIKIQLCSTKVREKKWCNFYIFVLTLKILLRKVYLRDDLNTLKEPFLYSSETFPNLLLDSHITG